MTDRLTDDEIAKLRYYKQACAIYPEMRAKIFGIPIDEALDRLLDEIEERRRAERSVATVFDEAAEQMTAEQWAKFQALMPKRKDGGA